MSECLDDAWWEDCHTDKYIPAWMDEDYGLLVSALLPM